MSLNDLHSHLMSNNNPLSSDPGLSSRVVDGIIKALDDANGEVQNLAVKWCVASVLLYDRVHGELWTDLRQPCSSSP